LDSGKVEPPNVNAQVGAGKTVAIRAALAGLDASRHTTIYLGNPAVGGRGLDFGIVTALGGVPRFNKAALIPQTAELLAAEEHERGRTVVLVPDEAHLLGIDELEELRLLTNADMDSHSPFACLLVGQPTLRRRIKLGTFAALDQRIALRHAMTGMSDTETRSYLTHHLKLAGRSDTLFSDDAAALIHQVSRGIPRAQSTTSPSKPSSPHSRPTKPSLTSPQQGQPSQKSRQNDHQRDPMTTKAPPEPTGGALFQLNTSSPTATPPSSKDATDNTHGKVRRTSFAAVGAPTLARLCRVEARPTGWEWLWRWGLV